MAVAIGMAACGENAGYDDTGTGGSIDSASTAPPTSPTDNTTVSPDTTTTMDTGTSDNNLNESR